MPWNEPGGGKDKDPWGSKNSSSGDRSNNIEDITKKMNEKLGGLFGKSGGGSGDGPSMTTLALIALVALFAWLATGFYTIGAAEQGVEFRFGAYKRLTEPGWHWQFPRPIESVEIVNVDKAREAEDDNIHMLTKDENIINLSVSAQYKVKDVKDYLFNIIKPDFERDQPQGTLYQVMRSALREVAGRNTLDMILTENRASIAAETQKVMQDILDQYGSGLELIKVNLTNATVPREVKEAFDDVNKAREDLERFKHEAETYAKRVVPVAKGKASRLLENASAYRSRIVARAEGDAARFSQLEAEYRKAPEVTRKRLYLETIEGVYKNSKKVLIDAKSGNNMLYLPLNQIQRSTTAPDDSNNAAISAGMNEILRQQQRQQQQQSIRDTSRSGVRQGRFQ